MQEAPGTGTTGGFTLYSSAAYAARYVAKNIVAAGLADKCEIQLSYAIGVAHPTSEMQNSSGSVDASGRTVIFSQSKESSTRSSFESPIA